MALNLGGVIRLTYAVKAAGGGLTNPATATLTITQPDGTTAPSIEVDTTPDVTGQLVVDFAPTQAGLHSVRWATTGPTTAEDDVFVAEAPGSMLVSVDDAVSHLRATGVITSDADREQLQWLCLVATDELERYLDRTLVRRSFTETQSGGSTFLLAHSPVLSVTSVTVGGVTLDPAYYALGAGGLLSATAYGPVTVTYVAGYANPPAVTRQAALQLVQAAWQSSQQAPAPFLDESSPESFVSAVVPGLSQIPGLDSLRMPAVA